MKRPLLLATCAGLLLTGCTGSLRHDVETLQQNQEALRKDVDEIKKLIQAHRPPAAVQALDQVLDIGKGPVKGQPDAKLTLMEFSDYQCPFCKRHATTTLPQIDREYIATGKLRYVFRDMPLPMHKESKKAAEAAHCAGEQGKYWEMHDRLFSTQQALSLKDLEAHGKSLDLQAKPFKRCLESGQYATQIEADLAEGQKLGITGTPTLLLGVSDGDKIKDVKMLRGAQPFATFKQEIDKLLEGKDAQPEQK